VLRRSCWRWPHTGTAGTRSWPRVLASCPTKCNPLIQQARNGLP
jgi:hypothetical protein